MNPTCISSGKSVSKDNSSEIRDAIASLLTRCDMPWPTVEYDQDFDAVCRADAIRRGYPMEGRRSLGPFVHMGVVMATTAYAHLKNESTKIFISHYTASLIYIDDVFQNNVDVVRGFNERFVQRQSHGDRVLDCFTTLLLELPRHYGSVVSNLITTSTLNLVTAMLIEYEMQGMKIANASRGYPAFARTLSGATEAYGLFVFPPELSLPTYIQALPELMIYLNYGNDILSFYKEELAGETVNYISLLASQRGSSKIKALWHVKDVVADAHYRILAILESNAEALDVYKKFALGYLGFHSGLTRYKLGELEL